jgi:hypothetical protein
MCILLIINTINLMKYLSVTLVSLIFLASCSQKSDNQLTAEEEKEGWKLLFDGKTLTNWHLYNNPENSSSAWKAENGAIVYSADSTEVEHEDLVSDKEFENFDLKFEWKISEEGNSGVFINVVERKDIPTAWASGPEYQLLDSLHPDYVINLKKRPGSLYNFSKQKNPVAAKPAGEWNHSRIKQENGKVEFYLNGIQTAEQDFNSEQWKEMVAKSGFSYFPDFGKTTKGKIALQKWYKTVAFKNIKIKEL